MRLSRIGAYVAVYRWWRVGPIIGRTAQWRLVSPGDCRRTWSRTPLRLVVDRRTLSVRRAGCVVGHGMLSRARVSDPVEASVVDVQHDYIFVSRPARALRPCDVSRNRTG